MCGIVGIVGRDAVAGQLMESLRRLEYRGYDSAGIATLEGDRLARRRAEGKLGKLQDRLANAPLAGTIGIGHTRWATHGRPSEANAHPHVTDALAVVHNGIIENFRELRAELESGGARFKSDTDTEVVAHLVSARLRMGLSPIDAVAAALPRLRGTFALVFLFDGEPDLLIGACRGSPLAVGYGDGQMYLGSDAIALAPFTQSIAYLEDGDLAIVRRGGAEIRVADGAVVSRPPIKSPASALLVDRGNYPTFMAKEIHEQPEVVSHTLAQYLDANAERVTLAARLPFDFRHISRVSISACGTAYYAGLIGKYWLERLARLPIEIDIASEFRYREVPLRSGDLSLFISQSGETADTLASLRYAKERQQRVLSIVNAQTSTIARESDTVLSTLAGPEIGVASTKAFTCQLSVLACLAIAAGRALGVLSQAQERSLVQALIEVPRLMIKAFSLEPEVERLARSLAKCRDVLYLGRGTSYPLALEGALKLKEISYIHAEGYAGGELKHGPIALIDEALPVIVIAPFDHVFQKIASNMEEVAARGGRIVLITDARGAGEATLSAATTLILPDMPAFVTPIVYAILIQLIAYHTATIRGTDVDQPRNLAKSVTVE